MLREFRYRLAYWSGVRPQPQELQLGQADVQHGAAFKLGEYRVSASDLPLPSGQPFVLIALSPQSAMPSNGKIPKWDYRWVFELVTLMRIPELVSTTLKSWSLLPLTAPQ